MDLELEARGHVYLAQLEELQKLVKAVQLDIKSVTELSREKLVATLQDWLTEVRGQEGGGQKTYQAVVKILQKSTPQPVKTQVEEPRTQVTVPEGPKKASVETVKLTVSEKPNMRVQKQFKICGEVDRAGISFASVNRQIHNGQLQGYSDFEIVDGVLKAIPSSAAALRNYLDSRRDLKIVNLKEILRAHYNEKTTTELYSELGSLVQGNKEGSTDFLIRAMDLRNKILLDSDDTSELKYDPELVHSLFCGLCRQD